MNQKNIVHEALQTISQLIENGTLREAKALCLSSLEQVPEDKDLLVKLSLIEQLMGNMSAAQAAFTRIDPQYLETLFFVHQSMDFYLRNNNYAKAKSFLDQANQANYHKPRLRKRTQKMNMIFNAQTEQKEDNVALAQSYIHEYPDDSFGYLYYIQSISHSKPDNLPTILDSLQAQIEQNGIGLNVLKKLFRTQQKFYSLLKINDYEIAQKSSRMLLIERLQILLNLNQDVAEINQLILELMAIPLTKSEFSALLRENRKYKPLEFQLIQHYERYPHWQDCEPIRQQIEIIRQNRVLQTTPLPNQVSEFPYPVDVVFTWCDMKDPIFLEKFKVQNKFDPMEREDESNGKFRFTNNQEIKLALISLFKYFADVNHIYIVTNEQQFSLDFLSIEQKNKISFIDHKEIMPREYISGEVFNSNLIETFVWNVPNLSEHFLYFNDDVILGNYLKPHHLFDQNNEALALTTPRKQNANLELARLIEYHQGEVVPWNISRVNAIRQFEIKNQTIQPFLNIHQGMFLVRSECARVFHKYQPDWQNSFFQEMLRGRQSVFAPLIYVWEAVLSGKQKVSEYYEYNRLSAVFNAGLNQENVEYIKKVQPLFYCLNHLPDAESVANLHDLVNHNLGLYRSSGSTELIEYLSEKSEVEKIIYVGLGSSNQTNINNFNVEQITLNLQECFGSSQEAHHQINSDIVDTDLLSQKLTIDQSVLAKSIVVFQDLVEELPNSGLLLHTIIEWSKICKYLLISTVAKDRVREIDTDSPRWTLDKLCGFLTQNGMSIGLKGYSVNSEFENSKTASLVVTGREAMPVRTEKLPVTAVINCFNESDIIADTVLYLVRQNINVVVVDNWSTDGSFEILTRLSKQHQTVQVNRFPETPSGDYNWNEQLINTIGISEQLGHGWYLHYDADEIRESPWSGVNLRDAISYVDSLGYNAIDFTLLTFKYLQNDQEYDYKTTLERLRYWSFGEHRSDFRQVKAWKYTGQPVNLNNSGGHAVMFEGRKIYPLKFLTKHYPLRNSEQAHQKLFCDRFPRIQKEKQKLGWHNHYDHITERHLEGWDKRSLSSWNATSFGTEYLVERISGIGIPQSQPVPETSATYQEAIRLQPKNSRLHYMLAKTKEKEGQIEEAIAAAKKALQIDPNNVDVVEMLSRLLESTDQVGEALTLVKGALESNQDNSRLYVALGNLQRKQRDFPAAIDAYRRSVELMPQNLASQIALNQLLFQNNQIEETISSCQNALEFHPDEFQLHFMLGKTYAKHQQWELAIASHQKASELNGNSSAIIHVHLGDAFTKLNRQADALASYQNGINAQPNSLHGYIGLGNHHRQLGEWSKAATNYHQAIRLNCQNIGVYLALGHCLKEQGKINEAIIAYQDAINLHPEHSDVYIHLGNCHRQQRNLELAASNYQQAMELDPKNAEICFTLGQVSREQGNEELAVSYYQKAVNLNHPNSFGIYKIIGDALSAINQIQPAISAYESAIKIQPNNPMIKDCLERVISNL